ncbi:MAG: EAL domain-containing protein, partial [Hylemonella sp.]|nr:EAL domain-containing protein [Hylemonella sp.]
HQQLKDLVKLGCSIALDDFGTGYSSLAYLKHLPISKLKIDRSFIQDLPAHGSDVKIIHAIIALAHSLKLTVLAEGVETLEQLAFLQANGCMTYQGWLYAKALPAAELTPRLQRRDAAATHTPLM